ncbi:MAG: lipopolysaccharide transport periplasmic protein LptA [Nitrospirae bacterium]|nr:lipopolysaccharide transport periplasmic protein LptA [Nitrospirota bacterium]
MSFTMVSGQLSSSLLRSLQWLGRLGSLILVACVLTAGLTAGLGVEAFAEETTKDRLMKGDKNVPLIITSKNLFADTKKKTAIFTGDVKAVKGETTFYADKMVVYYTGSDNRIDHIDATGNIKLVKEDSVVTAERAVYVASDDSVVFTGSPEARDSKNLITGTRMTYFLKDEYSIVENSSVYIKDKGASSTGDKDK